MYSTLKADKFIGDIKDITPGRKSRLNIFEPIIFPKPISSLPFLRDECKVANSGKEVPMASRKYPVNTSGIFKSVARLSILSIQILLKTKRTNTAPRRKNILNFTLLSTTSM